MKLHTSVYDQLSSRGGRNNFRLANVIHEETTRQRSHEMANVRQRR